MNRPLHSARALARRSLGAGAFTLIELMIVVSIMATLSLLAMVAIDRIKDRAARAIILNNLRQLHLAKEYYYTETGASQPSSVPGLKDAGYLTDRVKVAVTTPASNEANLGWHYGRVLRAGVPVFAFRGVKPPDQAPTGDIIYYPSSPENPAMAFLSAPLPAPGQVGSPAPTIVATNTPAPSIQASPLAAQSPGPALAPPPNLAPQPAPTPAPILAPALAPTNTQNSAPAPGPNMAPMVAPPPPPPPPPPQRVPELADNPNLVPSTDEDGTLLTMTNADPGDATGLSPRIGPAGSPRPVTSAPKRIDLPAQHNIHRPDSWWIHQLGLHSPDGSPIRIVGIRSDPPSFVSDQGRLRQGSLLLDITHPGVHGHATIYVTVRNGSGESTIPVVLYTGHGNNENNHGHGNNDNRHGGERK